MPLDSGRRFSHTQTNDSLMKKNRGTRHPKNRGRTPARDEPREASWRGGDESHVRGEAAVRAGATREGGRRDEPGAPRATTSAAPQRGRGGERREVETAAGETAEVFVERILPGGAGLAHHGGATLLVALAAPGERVRVRVEGRKGRVARASILEVLEPSPARVEPPCPYFGRCGGCDFQQLNYEAQLAAKQSIVGDCLRRIARVELSPEQIPITASPRAWHYRSRAQWQHDARRDLLGYFERGSHQVCDVSACPVLIPELQATLSGLRERLADGALPAGAREFQAVAGDEGASLAPPVGGEDVREVSRTVGEHRYRFDAEGFFQINHELLDALVRAAIPDDVSGERALDLYCGVGLFTLPLARRFREVTGVEASAEAVAYARRNLADAGLTNAVFKRARVGDWLRDRAAKNAYALSSANAGEPSPTNVSAAHDIDFVLLDPPRAGAEGGAVGGILALRPRRIAYVSCDPATLARDLKEFIAGGYSLDSVAAFDMFPQTHHVETIAHLSAR